MHPKKQFLVFCAIFLTVALLLGLGAWRTRTMIESRGASDRREAPAGDSEPSSEPPAIQRFANPPSPAAPMDASN